jgi:hypothetical protein
MEGFILLDVFALQQKMSKFRNMKDRKRISQLEPLDTTHFQWCYDNYHFITATTAPRLRVKNG